MIDFVTIDEYKTYLERNLATVFSPSDPRNCPLSKCMSERAGHLISVTPLFCGSLINHEHGYVPEWAREHQDNLFGIMDEKGNAYGTECLIALNDQR